jgi:hypothetical protein
MQSDVIGERKKKKRKERERESVVYGVSVKTKGRKTGEKKCVFGLLE